MPQGQSQTRNAELVRLLSADFQPRYESAFAWSRAASLHLLLPGLRGFWPMSAFDSSGNAQDQSGHAHHLTYNGNPQYTFRALHPYIAFDGAGDYLARADEADLDITGTEAYVVAAARGMTQGGWFYFDNAASGNERIMTKRGDASNISWFMGRIAAGVAVFAVTSDGTAGTLASVSSTATVGAGAWTFIAGRFDPSTTLDVWVNGAQATNAAAIPASIFSGNGPFQVSGYNGATELMTGRAALCFLCAAALSDTQISSIFNATRALFGV